jgi:ribosomal protein L12E/L44/L45/RPP1/RPP2
VWGGGCGEDGIGFTLACPSSFLTSKKKERKKEEKEKEEKKEEEEEEEKKCRLRSN